MVTNRKPRATAKPKAGRKKTAKAAPAKAVKPKRKKIVLRPPQPAASPQPEEPPRKIGHPLEDVKEEQFAQYVLIYSTPTDAYHELHPKVTRGTAQVQSSILMHKPHIRARISELLLEAGNRAVATRGEGLRMMTERMRGNLQDYGVLEDDAKNPRAVREVRIHKTTRTDKDGVVEVAENTVFKLHDAVAAYRELAGTLGWKEPEKHEHHVEGELTIRDLMADANGATRGIPAPRPGHERNNKA